MRKIREILRLYHEMGLSRRQIAESLQIAHSTVGDVLRTAESSNARNPLLCSFCGMNTSRQTPMGSNTANSAPTIANGYASLTS